MFRSRLFWRLFFTYVIAIVISILLIGVPVNRQLTENNTAEIHQSLQTRAELLVEIARQHLLNPDQPNRDTDIQTIITKLGKNTPTRLSIIDSQGVVLADSQAIPDMMDNHLDRPEIVEARDKGTAMLSRYSHHLQQPALYRAHSVRDNDRIIGYVRVSLPQTLIDRQISQWHSKLLFSVAVTILLALLLGLFFAWHHAAPLVRMTEVAGAIFQGDYARRIDTRRQDEIGQLAKMFNRMALNSEQHLAEISDDHSRLNKILSSMVEGVIGVDQHHKINHLNQAAARLLELSPGRCIKQNIWEVVRVPEIIQAMEEAFDCTRVIKTQFRRPTETEDLVVDIYATALYNDSGESIGAVIVLNDRSELDRLGRIRRDFVANASHELKTPITAIRGLVETILDDPAMDNKTQLDFLNKIQVQSFRLSTLISDLMTISRLESSDHTHQFQTLNLSELLHDSVNTLKPVCEEKQIALDLHIVDRLEIAGDQQGIMQLIDNLLDNAAKYTSTGGLIEVSLARHQQHARLVVKDTGIGIDYRHQPRIFERFYRVDKARSRELGGTGLGLSIVKNIVEQHQGLISLHSRPGAGTHFTVLLPLA